jgi:hypothetical protein
MASPVEQLLSVIMVLVTFRSRISSWLTSRFTRETPVHDIAVGTPIEFDDLTNEFNEREVRQHDHYDRKKATQNEKKYVVTGDDTTVGDDVSKDQYNNEALEPLFDQICEFGDGFESLFRELDGDEAASSDSKDSHRQTSSDAASSVGEPKPGMHGDEPSSDAGTKDTAADELAAELKLRREAEARDLYKLYDMPPQAPKNNVSSLSWSQLHCQCTLLQTNTQLVDVIFLKDQLLLSPVDSKDSRVRLPWRQWINDIRNNMFSFHWTNPFARHPKTNKDKPMDATMTSETGKTEAQHPKENSAKVKVN